MTTPLNLAGIPIQDPKTGLVSRPWLLYLLGQDTMIDNLTDQLAPSADSVVQTVVSLVDQVRQELETIPQQQVYYDLMQRISSLEETPVAQPDTSMRIRSTQRGTITISGTATATSTITAVDTVKSQLRFLGYNVNTAGDQTFVPSIVLTNATTITATRNTASGSGTVVSWELTEWE